MDNFVKVLIIGSVVYLVVNAASRTYETAKYGKNGNEYINRANEQDKNRK